MEVGGFSLSTLCCSKSPKGQAYSVSVCLLFLSQLLSERPYVQSWGKGQKE